MAVVGSQGWRSGGLRREGRRDTWKRRWPTEVHIIKPIATEDGLEFNFSGVRALEYSYANLGFSLVKDCWGQETIIFLYF